MLEFQTLEKEKFTIISFNLKDILEPNILENLELPKINNTKGVILDGRGPIWLYCYMVHHYHTTKFIATHDPRLGGAVVVETHSPEFKVGNVLKLEE
ncbi:MAG: CRISPR-associated protein Csx3 [Candidatus Helarchaeota archaeon]|nr:CRISPR-associated protein Csx3 [Candidatus Helarchaeota archaeon]